MSSRPHPNQTELEVVILDHRRQWRLISAAIAVEEKEEEEEVVTDAALRPPLETTGERRTPPRGRGPTLSRFPADEDDMVAASSAGAVHRCCLSSSSYFTCPYQVNFKKRHIQISMGLKNPLANIHLNVCRVTNHSGPHLPLT